MGLHLATHTRSHNQTTASDLIMITITASASGTAALRLGLGVSASASGVPTVTRATCRVDLVPGLYYYAPRPDTLESTSPPNMPVMAHIILYQ